jgi:hypothetical protein
MNYKANRKGIEAMLCSEEMQAEMRRRAETVKTVAEATAPVDVTGSHPGRYKAAFRVEVGIKDAVGAYGPTRRAEAEVINDAPEARFVEYGTKNNPRHRTLGHALDAARL